MTGEQRFLKPDSRLWEKENSYQLCRLIKQRQGIIGCFYLIAPQAYARGQLTLDPVIQSIQNLAIANGWVVPQGVDTPSDSAPCYNAYTVLNLCPELLKIGGFDDTETVDFS